MTYNKFTLEFNNSLTFDDLLKNSFVICISDLQYGFFSENFARTGFKNQPMLIQGFNKGEFDNIEVNQLAMMSQVQIVHLAKALNLPFVVVFEDDSIFDLETCSPSELDAVVKHIPQTCNILSFGWYKRMEDEPVYAKNNVNFDKRIFEEKRSHLWGSNAYIMFDRAYDLFLQHLNVWAIDQSFDYIENVLTTRKNFFP